MLHDYSNHYECKVIFGDFNMNPAKPEMNTFLNTENLTNLIKENICFKGIGSYIDLILANPKYYFQYSSSIETGLSDHHYLIFSMMKTKLALEEPKRLVYFKSFSNDYFEEEVSSKLDLNNKDYAVFKDNFVNVLNKHAPKKTKFFRGDHKPHVSKTLRLTIMKRSRFKNKANKTQLPRDKPNYKKQRNLVTKLNKQFKKEYFDNIKDNNDSKNLWNKC